MLYRNDMYWGYTLHSQGERISYLDILDIRLYLITEIMTDLLPSFLGWHFSVKIARVVHHFEFVENATAREHVHDFSRLEFT